MEFIVITSEINFFIYWKYLSVPEIDTYFSIESPSRFLKAEVVVQFFVRKVPAFEG